MPSSRMLHTLVTLALTVGPVLDAAPQQPKVSGKWQQVTAPHFTLLSNAQEEETDAVALDIERFYQVLALTFNASPKTAPAEMTVYVFRSGREFDDYLPAGLSDKRVGGFYLPAEDRSLFVINADQWGECQRNLYRDYVQDLVRRSYKRLPEWLDRGLAEYYSSFRVDGTTAHIGRPIDDHIATLRGAELIPVHELLGNGRPAGEVEPGPPDEIFSAESWGLLHYLLHGNPELTQSFLRYFQSVQSGGDPAAAFTRSFTVSPQELETELEQYLTRPVFPFARLRLDTLDLDATLDARPLSKEEALSALSELAAKTNGASSPQGS